MLLFDKTLYYVGKYH